MDGNALSVTEEKPSTLSLSLKPGVVMFSGARAMNFEFAEKFNEDPVAATSPGCLLVSGDANSLVTLTNSNTSAEPFDLFTSGPRNGGLEYQDADISLSTSNISCAVAESNGYSPLMESQTTMAEPLGPTGSLYVSWKRVSYDMVRWGDGESLSTTTLINVNYQ
jgi:hypothetical protein